MEYKTKEYTIHIYAVVDCKGILLKDFFAVKVQSIFKNFKKISNKFLIFSKKDNFFKLLGFIKKSSDNNFFSLIILDEVKISLINFSTVDKILIDGLDELCNIIIESELVSDFNDKILDNFIIEIQKIIKKYKLEEQLEVI